MAKIPKGKQNKSQEKWLLPSSDTCLMRSDTKEQSRRRRWGGKKTFIKYDFESKTVWGFDHWRGNKDGHLTEAYRNDRDSENKVRRQNFSLKTEYSALAFRYFQTFLHPFPIFEDIKIDIISSKKFIFFVSFSFAIQLIEQSHVY